jgi:hypothetical protein
LELEKKRMAAGLEPANNPTAMIGGDGLGLKPPPRLRDPLCPESRLAWADLAEARTLDD